MRRDLRVPGSEQAVRCAHGHGFAHEALLYAGIDGFLAGIVPFVREGVRAGEAVLVAVPSSRLTPLRDALGDDAGAVTFADMEEMGRNPGRIIPVWRDFVDEQVAAGRPLRGVGEPVWDGRNADELAECRRHEALLNLAFGDDPPWALLCPYDVDVLDHEVVEDARRTHPVVWEGTERVSSRVYVDPHVIAGAPDDDLPPPPVEPDTLEFGREDVAAVRALVGRHAAPALPPERAADLVLAASEAATNSVRHGGGRGRVAVWRDGPAVVCEVRDRGRIPDPLAGRRRPALDAPDGRGLWIAHQVCDLVEVRHLAQGTVVRVRVGR